ncbi:MAG: hypothetical protein M3154_04740, partial [Candidatus Eremiobacteraeota bacterium]|nr:hypothetical protein [Candidatus Eremiobacteraeota bacterium]
SLPGGEDPDTFVRAHGRDALEAALAQGLDLLDWQLVFLQRKAYFADLHRTRRAIDKLLPTVRAASDPVTRDLYIAKLAEVTRLDRDVLQREVELPPQRAAQGVASPAPARDASAFSGTPSRSAAGGAPLSSGARGGHEVSADGVEYVSAPQTRDDWRARAYERRTQRGRRTEEWVSVRAVPRVPPDAVTRRAERLLVRAMVQDRALVETVAEKWQPEAFHEDAFRELFARLLEDPHQPLEDALRRFPEPAVRMIDDALSERDPSPDVTVASWLVQLQVRALDAEKTAIVQQMAAPVSPVSDEEKNRLTARLSALQAERAALSTAFGRVGQSIRGLNGSSDGGAPSRE